MCGFVGGILRRTATASDVRAFTNAVRAVEHRGPDDEGVLLVSEANAVLAFRRLSILDHAGGAQPMSTGAGHHLVFNGEIYNYQELRERLERAGTELKTRSDTEALLWTMASNGVPGLEQLVGMFAFALLDTEQRRLLLVRDRLGVKQLYYVQSEAGFFFASEPKALLQLPWVRAEIDVEQIPAYLQFRCAPAPGTLFAGVKKLGAGEYLELSLEDWSTSKASYWTLPTPNEGEGESVGVALDRFEAAFLGAVERRLIADVPVGAFLSGGLDSSLVVAAMRRLGHGDVATFSAIFPGSPDDEGEFARRVSRRFSTRHFEHAATAEEFLASLETWVSLNDDLVADASCLPLFAVSGMARRNGYIVLLSGEGSDELFGGYGSYHKFLGLNRMGRAVRSQRARTAVLDLMKATGVLASQDEPRAAEYLGGGGFMGTAALLGPGAMTSYLDAGLHPLAAQLPRAAGATMANLLAFDFRTRIPEDLMVRTDRATMGASIEARVPFLDPQVISAAFGLTPRQRALPGVSKVLLRLLAARWGVPRQTIYHRKIGFQIPIGAWFRSELRGVWTRILSERAVPGLAYPQIAAVYEAHLRGEGHFEELLWRFAALELWYRRWVLGTNAFATEDSSAAIGTKAFAV